MTSMDIEDKFTSWLQALNYEFKYYCYVLKKLTDRLTDNDAREIGEIMPWIKKLFSNEYEIQSSKEIRNRYLVYLIFCLINKETYSIFKKSPPIGPLDTIENIPISETEPAEWEVDTTWNDICRNIQNAIKPMKCSAHCDFMKCTEIVEINKLLDDEFQFMIYLVMPLWRNWPSMKDRKRAGLWIQTLCTLHYNCFCTNMRVIRNDYLMALLGYLYNKNLSGPFKLKPPSDTLYPLETMAIEYLNHVRSNALNPEGQLLNQFLVDQPLPENGGAFCFFAITGQVLRGGQRKSSRSCSCPCSDFRI